MFKSTELTAPPTKSALPWNLLDGEKPVDPNLCKIKVMIKIF